MWHFQGVKTYSDPSYIFSGGHDQPPTPGSTLLGLLQLENYQAAGAVGMLAVDRALIDIVNINVNITILLYCEVYFN